VKPVRYWGAFSPFLVTIILMLFVSTSLAQLPTFPSEVLPEIQIQIPISGLLVLVYLEVSKGAI